MIPILNKFKNLKITKWVKIFVFALILISFGYFLTYKITLPAAEDLPRQIANGRDILAGNFGVIYNNVYSYTNPDHQFANHHWLYGVFAYALNSLAGFEGIVIFKILTFLFAFCLLFYISLRKASFWLVALFSVPTILVILGRSAARPEMFSYLFIVLILYLIIDSQSNTKSNKIFWIIPIQLLWANLHIMFPVGVALVGSYWVAAIFKNWKGAIKDSFVKKLTLLLLLATIVSFINPLGVSGVIYSLKANTVNATSVFSAEVRSIAEVFKSEPKSDYIGAVIFMPMLILLGISFVLAYRRRPIFYLMLATASAFLSMKIIRGLPFFAIIFLPAITENLEPLYRKLLNKIRIQWPYSFKYFIRVVPVIFIILLIWGVYLLKQKTNPPQIFGVGLTETSDEPVKFFKANKLKGPILNDTDIGSYLVYYLYPNEKVFADNRFADAYTRDFLENEYQALFSDETKWQEILKKYDFNTIILNHYNRGDSVSDFIYRRYYDSSWSLVYAGRDAVIFIKNIPENQKIIETYGINQDNIQKKLLHLLNAPDFQGQVGAADLFAYTGNIKLALFAYEKIVSQWPKMGKIWFIIGRNELTRGDQANADTAFALIALQNAIKYGYKTPYSYSYLALAYYRMGDSENAQKAVEKELKIDPESVDGKAWLKIFLKDKLDESNANQ